MNIHDLEKASELLHDAAVEIMAQLARFVVRKQMTAEEAAVLAWDMAAFFTLEGIKRAEAEEK